MAAPGPSARREAPNIEALIEALDPEVRAAIDDVDRTLITLTLAMTPWNRLRSASRMAQETTMPLPPPGIGGGASGAIVTTS